MMLVRKPPDGRHEIYENLLRNVVLSRVLTKNILDDKDEQELILVRMWANAIRNCHKWIPRKTIQIFDRFELTQDDRTAETVSEQINALQPGETFAILLREQRTVFMIRMPANNTCNEKNDKSSQKNSNKTVAKRKPVASSDSSNSDDSSSDSSDSKENDNESKTVTIATFASGIEPKEIYTDYVVHGCLNVQVMMA